MSVNVRLAVPAKDMGDIERLCWAYRDFLVERTTHVPEIVDHYYEREAYADLIADLPRRHARPTGAICVAEHKGQIIGCAMYHLINPETCEIKRVFVDENGRGLGAAKALFHDTMERAADDGYKRMVLDTMHTLTEAISLYGRLGFEPCPPFYDPDPKYLQYLRFFGQDLPNRSG